MRSPARAAVLPVVALVAVVASRANADDPSKAAASADAPAAQVALVSPLGAAAMATPKTRTLAEALVLADKNHPNIKAARAQLMFTRAQLDEAHSAPFSLFKLSGGVGIAPELEGNNGYSPNNDVSLSSGVALAWRIDLQGVLPLWTFGKIGNLWEAAEANVKVNEANVEKERDLVRLEVRRAYYGVLLARDGKLLLDDVKKTLDKEDVNLKAKVEKGEGDILDLYKLETFASELDVRAAEAKKWESVALAGLRFYTGVKDFDVPDSPLTPPTHQLLGLDQYLQAATKYRPELAQAKYGLKAREAQVRIAEAGFYPDIGIGLNLGIGVAPEIDDQINPFAYDPANYFRYGAGLVFQWNLDFVPQEARLREAKAKLAEMNATHQLADEGVEAQVRVAYAEVVDWKARRDAYAKGMNKAKKWLIVVQEGIDVGTIEDKELLEPAKAYALNRFNTMNATMELDVAVAKLAQATGWDAIAPDGVTMPP